jgi:Na+/H+-dicarboxylate symporter
MMYMTFASLFIAQAYGIDLEKARISGARMCAIRSRTRGPMNSAAMPSSTHHSLLGIAALFIGPRVRDLIAHIRAPLILAFSTASSEGRMLAR